MRPTPSRGSSGSTRTKVSPGGNDSTGSSATQSGSSAPSTSHTTVSGGSAPETDYTPPPKTSLQTPPASAPRYGDEDLEAIDGSFFQALLAEHAALMPAPGPDYFAARRALWLQNLPRGPPTPPSPGPSRAKLEALLAQPGAVESDEVWRAGLKNVWKGLVGGNQLRKRLPLDIVVGIKFVHICVALTW